MACRCDAAEGPFAFIFCSIPQRPAAMAADNNRELRQSIRDRRARLGEEEIRAHSEAVARRLGGIEQCARARRIAAYVASRGEIDLGPFLRQADASGQLLYLPAVRGRDMKFLPWTAATELKRASFGLLEPAVDDAEALDPAELDLVLTPLVAFDDRGHRLGQGGGFYDRAFAFRRSQDGAPLLIGIAHAFQQQPRLEPQPWDLRVDLIVTEKAVFRPSEAADQASACRRPVG